MIRVNLLPHLLRPVKRTPLPYLAVAAIWVIALVCMALVFTVSETRIADTQKQLKETQDELATYQPIIDEFEELNNKKLQLKDKIETIEEIASERVIWSKTLSDLSGLVLDTMWYDSIEDTSVQIMKRVQEVDARTKKPRVDKDGNPVMKNMPVPTPALIVKGYITPDENGLTSLSPWLAQAEKDKDFSSMFTLESVKTDPSEYDDREAMRFEVTFLMNQGGSD